MLAANLHHIHAASHAVATGNIIDISPLVSPRIGVWPGDAPYRSHKAAHIETDGIDIGSLHSTYHVGAHTDAPVHYHREGSDITGVPLDAYVGDCQVIDVRVERGKRFGLADLVQAPDASRILFRTGTFPDPENWNDDFAAPEPALIAELGKRGVVLVGFDTPSTDLFASKGLESHQMLRRHGMMNLEGLVLSHVPAGHYKLIALPLRLEGADASPVRAVLIAE